jgi:predicted N-acetyltransferase YhbS
MNYTNLVQNPVYYADTIKLIENAFDYSPSNSFKVDFYPLVNERNHENCHVLIIDNHVVAHVGVLKKEIKINNEIFPIAMYGGIAVSEKHRGQGLFKELFNKVLEQNKDCALHLLWSDQLEMYERFGFYPAIEQIEFNESLDDAEGFTPTKLKDLNQQEIEQLSAIYDQAKDIRIKRTIPDWEVLKSITSSDLYIKKEGGFITNYFFMNKGEDLNGVIYEIGDFKDIEIINKFGVTWSPYDFDHDDVDRLFAAVLRIGDQKLFSKFIKSYTQNMIVIKEIDSKTVDFDFEMSNYKLATEEFLTGIFGPCRFEELSAIAPLYISGLDSI